MSKLRPWLRYEGDALVVSRPIRTRKDENAFFNALLNTPAKQPKKRRSKR
jgi:hypothetical protein